VYWYETEQGGTVQKIKNIKLALVAGLLFALVTLGSCLPASTDGGGEEGGTASFIPLVVILVLLAGMVYFLMIRPMRQREKKHDVMLQELNKGDKVITAGGIYGEIESIDETSVVLRVESGAKIRVTKGGVLNRQEPT